MRRRTRFRDTVGSIMTEFMISMLIVVSFLPIAMNSILVISKSIGFSEEIQDEIALAQLRRILVIGYNFKNRGNQLEFTYQGKEVVLSYKNNHLLLSPGTQIFLSEIDSCIFEEEGKLLKCIYERKEKIYEKVLVPF